MSVANIQASRSRGVMYLFESCITSYSFQLLEHAK